MTEERIPGRIPHEPGELEVAVGPDVRGGFDTDGDGRADTVVTGDGLDLVLLTDLDGDGLADQLLRIGPDGVVRETPVPGAPGEHPPSWEALPDGSVDGPPAEP